MVFPRDSARSWDQTFFFNVLKLSIICITKIFVLTYCSEIHFVVTLRKFFNILPLRMKFWLQQSQILYAHYQGWRCTILFQKFISEEKYMFLTYMLRIYLKYIPVTVKTTTSCSGPNVNLIVTEWLIFVLQKKKQKADHIEPTITCLRKHISVKIFTIYV